LFGYTAGEAIGQPITMLIPPHLHDEEKGILARLRRGERIDHFETTRVSKMGEQLDISLTVSPVRDRAGKTIGASKVARNITEQKRARRALVESERRFARFMQCLPGLAWIKDIQGRYVFVNDAAQKPFRKTREELYGKTDDEVFPPDIAAQFKENDKRALASEAGVQVVEVLEHDDGVHYSIVSKFPIPSADGKPAFVGGVAIDITDRMRAETALREADRRKDEFLATLAHELRNPLAPIRNSLHILRMTGNSGPVAERTREMMERQVAHMVRLVDDLLELSRISRGKIDLKTEPVELAAVIAHALETSKPFIDAARHQLSVSLPSEPVVLVGDLVRLAQVFSNLLNNAAKYTDPGGSILVNARCEGSDLVVSIRDTGIGIPRDMLSRVFEMFAQVDNEMRRTQDGLGIGLSLVRSLVSMHGGRVEAFSEGLGRGSEFVVRLPLAQCNDSTGGVEQPSTVAERKPAMRRILVVDDNKDSADSLGMLLKLGGADVQTAYDGPSALEAIRIVRPSVVLLDLGLPGLDGYEVARRVRQDLEARDVVLIALTGWGQEEDRRRTREAGFNHHLVKPVDLEALQSLLSSLDETATP
jgi:PAS domain S-box-containing protein